MADYTLLHNPKCSTSRHAKELLEQSGADVEVVDYLKNPLDEVSLRSLLSKLEDPETDLVRRDSFFAQNGLTDADVVSTDQIVELLVDHPRLMQRPVIIRGEHAIIGRPKDRVEDFIG